MSSPSTSAERPFLEFDEFRIDPKRRRLYRRNEPVSITPKAFAILLLLVDRRGEIVEKEDLLKEVWPDTFVTEANLTQNVSALRKALGESANDSRFVVTVPGRGYSFAGDIREVPRDVTGEILLPVFPLAAPGPEPEGEPSPPSQSLSSSSISIPVAPAAPVGGRPASSEAVPLAPPLPVHRLSRLAWVAGALVLAALAAWLAVARPWHRAPPAGDAVQAASGEEGDLAARPTVAVLGFKNVSGREEHAWIATALGEMLTTELGASPSVRMIASDSVARLRSAPLFAYSGELAPEQLERLHSQLGADLIVLGTYLVSAEPDGDKVRLDLRVLRTPGGDLVATLGLLGSAGNLIDLGTEAGAKLRLRLGWSEPSPEAARAVAALQPSSTRSAQLYAQGLDRLRAFDAAGARNLLADAVEADPESALFRSVLSQAYTELGSDGDARREAEAALKRSAALPREQRLEIEARFRETRQDWERASEIYRSLWLLHPERMEYGLRLINSLSMAGRGNEGLKAVADLRRLPQPLRDDPRIDLAEAQNARKLGDPTRQLAAAKTAETKGLQSNQPLVVAEALLLQGDARYSMGTPDESVRALQGALQIFQQAGNKAAVARTLNRIGAADLDTGRLEEAWRQFSQAKAIAEELGSDSLVAAQLGTLGITAMRQGDLRLAARLCEDSYRRFVKLGDRFYETRMLFFLAQAQALAGETVQAQERLNQVVSLAQGSGNRVDESQAQALLGTLLIDAGRFSEGRKLQEEALRLAREHDDPFLAASYLADIGVTLGQEGKFDAAEEKLAQALADKKKVKDRVGEATVLGRLAGLALRRGELAAARSLGTQQLALARQVGAGLEEIDALRYLAQADLAAADLKQARRRLTEAMSRAQTLVAGRQIAALKVDLSRLALAEGSAAQAAVAASEAAGWYHQRKIVGGEGRALLGAADAAIARGRLDEAAKASSRAFYLSSSPTDEDRELKLGSMMRDALAAMERRSFGEAGGHLGGMLESARKDGEIPLWLEARSIEATLLLRRGDRVGAAAAFQALARDATARGYLLLARRAAEAAQAGLRQPIG